jgi:hypothetical protein
MEFRQIKLSINYTESKTASQINEHWRGAIDGAIDAKQTGFQTVNKHYKLNILD